MAYATFNYGDKFGCTLSTNEYYDSSLNARCLDLWADFTYLDNIPRYVTGFIEWFVNDSLCGRTDYNENVEAGHVLISPSTKFYDYDLTQTSANITANIYLEYTETSISEAETPGLMAQSFVHEYQTTFHLVTLIALPGTFPTTGWTISGIRFYDFAPDKLDSQYIPIRQGYKFLGFYSTGSYSSQYYNPSGYKMLEIYDDITLEAKWEEEPANPWDNVDENAPACQAYIDDNGTMYARNFRIHSADTIIIDDLGDVYAKSFNVSDIVGMSSDGLMMKAFNLIRETGYNIRTITDANNNIVVDNNNNIIVAAY